MTSCGDIDSNSNQIIDETGISISLEWTIENSTVYGPDEADLDLRLHKDQAIVSSSTGIFTYEQVDFSSDLADGLYEIEITTDAVESINYSLEIQGQSTSQSLFFYGSAPSSIGPYQIIPITINKTDGGNFTFN
jgi:hypothetical protein